MNYKMDDKYTCDKCNKSLSYRDNVFITYSHEDMEYVTRCIPCFNCHFKQIDTVYHPIESMSLKEFKRYLMLINI